MRGNPEGRSLSLSGNHRGPTAAPLPEDVENTHHSLQGFSWWTRLLPACQYRFFYSFFFFFFSFLHFLFVHIEHTHANIRFKVLTAVLTKESSGIRRRTVPRRPALSCILKLHIHKNHFIHMNTISISHMIDIKIAFLWCDKKQHQNLFITTIHTFF
jgi:hypothetical protein